MKKQTDQYTFERARRLHEKILKLTRNARDSEDDDRIEKEKDKLLGNKVILLVAMFVEV